MRNDTLPIVPALLAAILTGLLLPAATANAQAMDPKDQEIQLLKTEIQKLERE